MSDDLAKRPAAAHRPAPGVPAVPPARCAACPLRGMALFLPVPPDVSDQVQQARTGARRLAARRPIYLEGAPVVEFATLFDGWAFRYKTTPEGGRQILDFVLPGDFLGLHEDTLGRWNHSAESLTAVSLCILDPQRVRRLVRDSPEIASRLSAIAHGEQAVLFEHMAGLGRRSAPAAVAHLLLELFHRIRARQPEVGGDVPFPLSQPHIADALGLSPEYVNRVLRDLREAGQFRIEDRRLCVPDFAATARAWDFDPRYLVPRPLV